MRPSGHCMSLATPGPVPGRRLPAQRLSSSSHVSILGAKADYRPLYEPPTEVAVAGPEHPYTTLTYLLHWLLLRTVRIPSITYTTTRNARTHMHACTRLAYRKPSRRVAKWDAEQCGCAASGRDLSEALLEVCTSVPIRPSACQDPSDGLEKRV